MSFVYVPEPQTKGKIILKTTFGDLEVGLWTKECPKATRNFVQLCLDKYYDDNLFFRVERNFIAISGDPTNSGEGGKSIYGDYFRDEIHSRLKFNKRGLLATANSEKNGNNSRFFFTLAATPELQSKHTIFGKVLGDSIYNLIRLNDLEVDLNNRTISEAKILSTQVVENPFTDLKPSNNEETKHAKEVEDSDDEYSDARDTECIEKRIENSKRRKLSYDYSDSDQDDLDITLRVVDKPYKERKTEDQQAVKTKEVNSNVSKRNISINSESVNSNKQSHEKSKEEKLIEIRSQLDAIRKEIESTEQTFSKTKPRQESKDKEREKKTLSKLDAFLSKLKNFSQSQAQTSQRSKSLVNFNDKPDINLLEEADGNEWLAHKFNVENDLRLARDANTKTDDWYSISDPRHPSYNKHKYESRRRRSENHKYRSDREYR